ncbi:MAG: Ldh family oxidoreductase [Candidatus Rokubacteria bacterium]|nr:Ldh family oxidoreductase [Candidatus Rokubacteria bacterium]
MPTLPAARLEEVTRNIFTAHGLPSEDAAHVATLLLRANLRGHDSHGVIRIPQYVDALQKGYARPRPHIRVESETPTTARLDGDLGFGQVVGCRGTELAIAKARAHGISAVTFVRTNHLGRLADYAEMAAAAGLIGLLWANAPTALNVAPWGGAARRLGTNPHAVAIPGPDGTVALSLDFATSVIPEGKMRVRFNRGETVPPGIMLDGAGRPSTDPRQYYTTPPGSLLPAGQHKGYGLALAIEILGGILSGTGAARAEQGPVHNGTLVVCLDVERFLPLEDLHRQVADLFGWVRSAPLAEGATEILIPGEPEARTARERLATGIPVEDETWRQIQACAAAVGVPA